MGKTFKNLREVLQEYVPERLKEIDKRGHPILCKCKTCLPHGEWKPPKKEAK